MRRDTLFRKSNYCLLFIILVSFFLPYIAVRAEENVTTPKVKSISIDKKEATLGDTIKITVQVMDNMLDIELMDVYYRPESGDRIKRLELKFNSEGKYEGIVEIDAHDEEGEWLIENIHVRDEMGNESFIYPFDPGYNFLSEANFIVKRVDNPGWLLLNNKWYYYSEDKTRYTGWISDNGTWYYLNSEGVMQTGWILLGGKWYYLKPSGAMAMGWQQVKGKWYYLESNGSMTTGWVSVGGKWYYMDKSGAMLTGWVSTGGKWYYMDSSGVMQTGWQKVSNRWYYLNKSGAMLTGWVSIDDKWYYMDKSGVMKTGWQRINNNWYYLSGSGVMQTGWIQTGGEWYYMEYAGTMVTGWRKVDNKWYYMKSSGAMARDTWISGKYYVGTDGAMYENSWTPDGYYVGKNGIWIPGKGREIIQKGNILIKNPDTIDVLVNKVYVLPSSYVPSNLVIPNVSLATSKENNRLRKEAAGALEKLFKGASDSGYKLYARSGYRSYNTQKSIFERNVKKYGSVEKANRTSAKAGQSEHQTGLAMDITLKSLNYELTTSFGNTVEGKWVAKNAHKYGFIIRYPEGKESITGYSYEPWHIRFVGVDLATKIYNSGLTYEEYLGY